MKLEGIRVLDLSRFLPGPHLAMMMADHGADVIKVEDPKSGDPARVIGPAEAGHTVYFRNANRGKRSLAVDLKSGAGREAFMRLAETADVVLETFRPGVVDRLGIGYEAVQARAPQVVYASISAFGQSGPYRDRPAHDLSVNALAGVASLSVDGDGKPAMACLPPSDMGGSLMALAGILMALLRRQTTGRGDYLDLSMFDTVVSWTSHVAGRVFADGRAPDPSAERTQGGAAFYRPYRTRDGRYITLGGGEMKFVVNFLEGVGRPDLIPLGREPAGPRRPRSTPSSKRPSPPAPRPSGSSGSPAATSASRRSSTSRRPSTTPTSPRGTWSMRDDDGASHLGIPIKFQEEPGRIETAVPALGQHSTAILREIGYDEAACAALARDGVIRQAD